MIHSFIAGDNNTGVFLFHEGTFVMIHTTMLDYITVLYIFGGVFTCVMVLALALAIWTLRERITALIHAVMGYEEEDR